MDDNFKAALIGIADEGELSREYLLGFRRGLQRGFYGTQAVADAEHEAWLSFVKNGQLKLTERSHGYADGIQVAVESVGSEA